MTKLSAMQAYLAMFNFLEDLQVRTHSEDLAGILGDMQINKSNQMPMDIGIWTDWNNAVNKVFLESPDNEIE